MKKHLMLGAMVVMVAAGNCVHAAEVSQWQNCKEIGSQALGGFVGEFGALAVAELALGIKQPWQKDACACLGAAIGAYSGLRLARRNLEDSDDTALWNKVYENSWEAFAIGYIAASLFNDKIFHFENRWLQAIWMGGCGALAGCIAMVARHRAELQKIKAYYAMSDLDLKILAIVQDSTENAWSIDELEKYYQNYESPLHAMCEHMSMLRIKLMRARKNIGTYIGDIITNDGRVHTDKDCLIILDKRLEGLEKALFLIDQKANRYLSMQVNQEYIL